jgi:hypothetical protein
MKRIDPTERALDAYFQLDTDQKEIFKAAVKHVDRAIEQLGHSVDYCKPQDETKPKRGRPQGSKNRKAQEIGSAITYERAASAPTAQELELRHNNGAATEGL